MKKLVFVIFFVQISLSSFGQGVFGMEGGFGTVSSYNNYFTPCLNANYLKLTFTHIYFGCDLDFRFYSFVYRDALGVYANPNYGNVQSINHKSAYLFVSPKLDVSIGEKEYIHLNIDAGPGFFMFGKEQTYFVSHSVGGTEIYNNLNTSSTINRIIFHYGIGLTEYIPLSTYWVLSLSQKYSILGRDLNTNWGYYPPLTSDYFSLTIGLSHFYNRIYFKY